MNTELPELPDDMTALIVVMRVMRSTYDRWTEEQRAEVQRRAAEAVTREVSAFGREKLA